MNKKIKFLISLTIHISIFLILIMPVLSFAQAADGWKGLVPCDNVATKCDFNAFMDLVNTIIRFVLFYMAVPIAAIMFAYAGFLLVTAGGEAAHARTEAKNIFTNALIGLVFAAAAWLIVRTILSILGYDGAWIGF